MPLTMLNPALPTSPASRRGLIEIGALLRRSLMPGHAMPSSTGSDANRPSATAV